MSELLVEMLAWAALETWFTLHPSGRTENPENKTDKSIQSFVLALPEPLRFELRSAYYRRLRKGSSARSSSTRARSFGTTIPTAIARLAFCASRRPIA